MLSRLAIILFAASLVAACTIEFIDNDGDDDDQGSLDGGGVPDARSDAWWPPDVDGGELDAVTPWPDAGTSLDATIDAPATFCGNAIVESGEQCDNGQPGVNTATCDRDCTFAACGDALVNFPAGEQCDTGGASPSCDVDCTAVVCGDGLVNPIAGEQCDDGNNIDTDACRNNCTLP